MADDIKPDTDTMGAASALPDPGYRRTERGVITKAQTKGLEFARTANIEPQGGGVWMVNDAIVQFERNSCNCVWYQRSRPRTRCADWWAVAYTVDPPTEDEVNPPELRQQSVVPTPIPSIAVTSEMPSEDELGRMARERIHGGYSRFKTEYNDALTKEFRDTMFFIRAFFPDIAPALDSRVQKLRGPKNTSLADLLFSSFIHAHFNWSYRRTEGFLDFLADPEIHFIKNYPGFNLASDFVRDSQTTPILRDVLALSAEPFRHFGKMTIAADGTGASSNRFDDWRVEGKAGNEPRVTRRWFKAHAACDVDSLAVVSVHVTHKDKSEKIVLVEHIIPELRARGYDVEKFLADAGYNSTSIRELIIEVLDAVPYIPWAANSVNAIASKWQNKVKHGKIVEEIYHAFKTDEGKAFKAAGYAWRVKVENLFSSIKMRHGGSVRSLDGNGPENEILLKCICHNVHMLLMASRVYGIDLRSMMGEEAA